MSERISNIGLLLRCGLQYLVRGNAKKKNVLPKTVVIVQFGKLGDMVCTTPMFRAIKKHAPATRVVVVGDKIGGQVLAGNTDVDRYIVCGTDIEQALEELKSEHADVGITAGPSSRAVALLYLAGIPMVLAPKVEGGVSSEGRLYRLLRGLVVVISHRMGQYAPREYLRMLEPLGVVADDTQKYLTVNSAAHDVVETFWAKHGLVEKFVVGITPSAGNKIKQWPPERFAAVADHLHKVHGASVLIFGGPTDSKEVSAMRGKLNRPVLDTSGTFSVEELKAAIAKLSLFISVDTGPIYIAEALGVPTIDIVGPVDEHEQPPIGPKHIVVVPPDRKHAELYVMNPYGYDYAEAVRQVESITVEQVTAAADGLIAQLTK